MQGLDLKIPPRDVIAKCMEKGLLVCSAGYTVLRFVPPLIATEDDIDKAVREAQQYEAEDKKKKEAVDARNEADSMVFQTEKALKEVGDKIPEADRSQVQADVDALKEALKNAPADGTLTDAQLSDIKSLKEKLMNSSQAVFTKMYEQAQQQAQAGGTQDAGSQSAGGAQAPGGDNVVDGDYKEV